MPRSQYVLMGNWGCFLPLLIMFNLLFGKLVFNSTATWLGVELALVLIFMLKIKFMLSRIRQQFQSEGPVAGGQPNRTHKPLGKVIDIQGQEVKDDKELR